MITSTLFIKLTYYPFGKRALENVKNMYDHDLNLKF